jgi:hypothetical protein
MDYNSHDAHQCVSGLSVFVVSGDVFYTLSFYLRTLRTMSRFGWGGKGSRYLKKLKKLTNRVFYLQNRCY